LPLSRGRVHDLKHLGLGEPSLSLNGASEEAVWWNHCGSFRILFAGPVSAQDHLVELLSLLPRRRSCAHILHPHFVRVELTFCQGTRHYADEAFTHTHPHHLTVSELRRLGGSAGQAWLLCSRCAHAIRLVVGMQSRLFHRGLQQAQAWRTAYEHGLRYFWTRTTFHRP
jgi:hypothetical protein